MYRHGLGCDVDIAESIKYEEMAAIQGHTGGCGQLAYLYQIKGFINYQKAFKYAKLAADAQKVQLFSMKKEEASII